MIDPLDRLRRFGIGAWALVGGFVVVAIVAWLLAQVRILWGPVVFATGIIYVLNPVVSFLKRRGLPRGIGALIAYLMAGSIIVLAVAVLVPIVADQSEALTDQLPLIYDDSVELIDGAADRIGITDLSLLSYDELVARITAPDEALQADIEVFVGRAFTFALDLAEVVVLVFLTPVIAFYLLVDLPRIKRHALGLIPIEARDEAQGLAANLGRAFGGFIRGQMMVALLVATISSFGLWALGVELWLILGILAGFFNLIPFIGPWFSGTLAVIVTLILGDLQLAIFVGVLFVGVQQLDNQIISPLVLRATVKLHPSLIIMALLVGSSLYGIMGLVLAVPMTAFVRVIVSHFWRTRVLGESVAQASEAFTVEYDPPSPESLAGRLRRIGQMQVSRPAMEHRDD